MMNYVVLYNATTFAVMSVVVGFGFRIKIDPILIGTLHKLDVGLCANEEEAERRGNRMLRALRGAAGACPQAA